MSSLPDGPVEGKVCNRCGEWKPLNKYKVQSDCLGGYQHSCKTCEGKRPAARARRKRWEEAHKEELAVYHRQWDEARKKRDPGYGTRKAADYIARNRSKVRERVYKHNQRPEVRARINAQKRALRAKDPDRFRVYNSTRAARKKQAGGSWTKAEWQALLVQHESRCLSCGSTSNLCADHVQPLSKGGSNSISNIQPLCRSCNSRKRDKTIDYRPHWHSPGPNGT
jgi:5-methylcytosine-specific restriction endonuclease McrA